jgi:predicted dehydrogenase
MESVKWLLVGAGDIAFRRVGAALKTAEHSDVVAICDLNEARARNLAERLNVKTVYTDYDRALEHSGADAVYVATPQNTHIELSSKALNAGKHLLCEKPLGLNGSECIRLLEISRKSNIVASCSNYRRLSEQYKLTESMLKKGEIGKFLGGWGIDSEPFFNPGKYPVRKALGMSRIKELGFYMIDIVQNFFGMPSEVLTRASIFNKDVMNDVEELAVVLLQFPGGAIFTIIFNSGSPGTRNEMEFFGSIGRIYWQEWPPHGNGPVIKITAEGTEKREVHTDENFHRPMIADFVKAVIENRQPVCTLESAVKTEIITDAIFRSMETGNSEPVVWRR